MIFERLLRNSRNDCSSTRFVGFSYLFLLREIQREVDSLGIKKSEGEKVFYWNLSNIRIYREREREELKIRNCRVYFSTNRYTVSGGASRVCVYEIMESWRNIKVRREGETTKGKRGGRA